MYRNIPRDACIFLCSMVDEMKAGYPVSVPVKYMYVNFT